MWSLLSLITIEGLFSAATTKLARELNKRIEAILAKRADIDAQRADVADRPAADLTTGMLKKAGDLRYAELHVLQEEVALRNDLAALDDRRREDLVAARDAALEVHRELETEVRWSLVGIGYVDAPVSQSVIGKITPGMIASHPKVYDAKGQADSLFARFSDTSFRQVNARLYSQATARVDELRKKLLAQ